MYYNPKYTIHFPKLHSQKYVHINPLDHIHMLTHKYIKISHLYTHTYICTLDLCTLTHKIHSQSHVYTQIYVLSLLRTLSNTHIHRKSLSYIQTHLYIQVHLPIHPEGGVRVGGGSSPGILLLSSCPSEK